MKKCNKCGMVKTWQGDDPKCPFVNAEVFNDSNWNCGQVAKIRNICSVAETASDARLNYQFCEDQKYVTIRTSDIADGQDEDVYLGLCLWITWYKSRGRTEQMWILGEDNEPKEPTFHQLQLIIEYYEEYTL